MRILSSKVSVALAGCIVIGLLSAAVVFAISGSSADSNGSSKGCAEPAVASFGERVSPAGEAWIVRGNVRNNGGCDRWLLKLTFTRERTARGGWQGGWGIPAGGHLSPLATISAQDELLDSERVFSGVVGAHVRDLSITTASGARLSVQPTRPPMGLRTRFDWLGGLKTFIYFYPSKDPIRVVRLRDGNGQVSYVARGFEGIFEGPM